MAFDRIELAFWSGPSIVGVRELTGHDERAVAQTSTRTAVQLLSRVVETTDEWQADELTAPDRDRLLAEVYRRTFGPHLDSTPICTVCGSPFDLSLALDDLCATVEGTRQASKARQLGAGMFETVDGLRFRIPTAREEIAAAEALSPHEAARYLAELCVVAAPQGMDAIAVVEEALEDAAPVIDLDVTTSCPECGAEQQVRFDLQFYVLRALCQERQQLMREIHRIAWAYGWSHGAILDLPRSDRRALVELIDSELTARRRW